MEEIDNKSSDNQTIVNAEKSLEEALQQIKGDNEQPAKRETIKLKSNIENKENNEISDTPNQTEYEQDNKDQQKGNFVETDDPDVQRKINEFYRSTKESEARNMLLQDELKRVLEETERRELAYQERLKQLEVRNEKIDEENYLSTLRKQYDEAIQNFDYEKASIINEKLLDFKTEQNLNKLLKQQQEQQRQQAVRTKVNNTYSDANPIDVAELNILTSEKDSNGQIIRPYLNENHPRFNDVVNATAIIADRYLKKGQRPSLSKVISEVEGVLNLRNGNNSSQSLKHPPVLSSNTSLGATSVENQTKLTQEQKTYATRLGISEKEYSRILRLSNSGPISVETFKK